MIFNDRQEAANKLYKLLKKAPLFKKEDKIVVVSILRGGLVLGSILASKLGCKNLPLAVTKVSSPYSSELAIGAICFNITYLEKENVTFFALEKGSVRNQIKEAEYKFIQYCIKFGLSEKAFTQIKSKVILLVDDGIATGASVRTALLFLRSKGPAKVHLAVPVAAADTNLQGFDETYILNQPRGFRAVSQYYRNFPQVEDHEVKKLLTQ